MGRIPNLDSSQIQEVTEGAAGDVYPFTFTAFVNGVETPLTLAQISALTVTVYDAEVAGKPASAIVNARNLQPLIAGGVMLAATDFSWNDSDPVTVKPTLYWTLTALDTAVRHQERPSELRGILFFLTHSGGGPLVVQFGLRVLNLRWVG